MRENTDQKLLRIWTLFTQSPLICSENQWNGFYMITASAMKELNVISEIYFHVLKTGKGRKNLRCNLLETCFVFDIFKIIYKFLKLLILVHLRNYFIDPLSKVLLSFEIMG